MLIFLTLYKKLFKKIVKYPADMQTALLIATELALGQNVTKLKPRQQRDKIASDQVYALYKRLFKKKL